MQKNKAYSDFHKYRLCPIILTCYKTEDYWSYYRLRRPFAVTVLLSCLILMSFYQIFMHLSIFYFAKQA